MRKLFALLTVVMLAIALRQGARTAGQSDETKTPPPAPAADRTLVLNEQADFRIYYQFGLMRISTPDLKTDGEALLGEAGLQRLERETRQHVADRKLDWTKADWRDVACVHFARTQLGDDSRAAELIRTIPAPDGWASADFDDASWMRQRIGRLPTQRYSMEAYEFAPLLIRTANLRTYFEVDDPAKAGELVLNAGFRGGARVLVNGKEVARAFLPDGELTGDAPAVPYPREAHVVLPEEGPQPRGGCFADIRCEWKDAPSAGGRKPEWKDYRLNAMGHAINEAGWNRLKDLRDRKLAGVKIPASLLKKGRNVLAIEVRGAHFNPQVLPGAGGPQRENWAVGGGTDNNTWDHCRLLSVELRAASGQVASVLKRPAGVQVWAEDVHRRLFSPDYNPPAWPTGKITVLGAPNGTFGGMAVVGTDRELKGLTASVSELKGAGGTIAPSAIKVGYLKGRSILELYQLGEGRCLGMYSWQAPMAVGAVARYQLRLDNPPAGGEARQAAWNKLLSGFEFFDQIADEPPPVVAADTCQPVWVSVRVPAEAPAGKYTGLLKIAAAGAAEMTVPVELEVVGWRIPSPAEFQTVVESEQSPYGVHKAYKNRLAAGGTPAGVGSGGKPVAGAAPAPAPMKLWSDEHFTLIDASFQQLARLGADVVFVPVLLNSEFGNRDDQPIRWTRRKDGSYSFDYAIVDRYLDVAVKRLGVPRVLCFQIMHGCPSGTSVVKVFDEATGKEEVVDVGPNGGEGRRAMWRAFATSLQGHLRPRGLAGSLTWGHAFDMVFDPELVKMMAEFTPGVYWAAGAHARKPDATFRCVARAYGSDIIDRSLMGWKNPFIHLVMPRTNGAVICVEGTSTPFTYRVLSDRAIYCGFNGIGRMGADYFDVSWFEGFSGGQYLLVGRSCVQTLWDGPGGADTSARNEAMLEGVQEAEARIFIEQALDRGDLPKPLAAEAESVLDEHFRATLHIPGGTAALTMMDYAGDWQARSRRLFATAAKVAAAVGVDVDRMNIGTETVPGAFYGAEVQAKAREGVPLPAEGSTSVSLKLRNWDARPRAWSAATTQPWIKPAKTGGEVGGQESLAITLDGKGAKPGETLAGTLTVTDKATGHSYPVAITAAVVKAVELIVKQTEFNITLGESETRDFLLVNRTDAPAEWKLSASETWLTPTPAAGKLAAGESAFVAVTAKPSDKTAAKHQAKLTLDALGGKPLGPLLGAGEAFDFTMYVMPAYETPPALPGGESVALEAVSKDLLASHKSVGWFRDTEVHSTPTFGATLNVWHGHQPLVVGKKTYPTGLWVLPPHETVYNIEGKGYTAFSAEVGWNAMVARQNTPGSQACRMSFEVYADEKPIASSGLMKSADPARLIVGNIPPGAKTLRLTTRATGDVQAARNFGYSNWVEAKLYKGK